MAVEENRIIEVSPAFALDMAAPTLSKRFWQREAKAVRLVNHPTGIDAISAG